MSESPITTPAQIMAAIYADLSRWASGRQGTVHIARDLESAVTMPPPPSGWSATLHWQGDDPAGTGTRRGNVVENNLRIFIRANLGPSAKPDIALIQATAARPGPFLDLVAALRTQVLRYTIPGVRAPGNCFSYKGCTDQAAVGGYLVAVYSLLFGVWSVIEMPETDEMIALAIAGA